MVERASFTKNCPRCGRCGARIQYGLPAFGPELERELEAGTIVLGGCVVGPMTRQCDRCGLRWVVPGEGRDASDLGDAEEGPRIEEFDPRSGG